MDCIEITKKLIKIDSSNLEGANKAIDFCQGILSSNGLKSEIIVNNGFKTLVCNIGSGNKKIILNGHLDIVAGKADQFTPYIEDGKLYGRGSADMKSGAAAMLSSILKLKAENLDCKVQIQLVTDEEIGGFNCSKYLVDNDYKGDFVICGEPTQLGIGVQAKGILQVYLEFIGKSAHGSRPWQGDNAILKAHEAFKAITNLPFTKENSELYSSPSINLSKIEGGDVYNKVPDYCKMCLDIRFLPDQEPQKIIKQIEKAAGVKVNIHAEGDAVKTKVDDSYVVKLSQSIDNITNCTAKIFGQHGSADTKFYSKYNIPSVEFGPTGQNWHGDDEFVIVDSVYAYEKILIDFILNLNSNL
ncbi:M20/M25/M40 family metallo-hydrolase [Clostridiaceae bacterium UIB06]|uniref:M20/M25/M40 family metallo-hydrolase n=1 Tax=Clostridium thailandense TaxID=2794346 RepID=A0A949WWT5_9CLOT|nr:M20/M25/M40 family metallo-hydrolase [Clostridium thailandense]MBV7275182.1 M20/M25/M40 family metallo-hydrolase [Clostridium thailandense]MCH5137850.1 M20/M25/M40 family metallo-hydrolase [Clostridiaceae bacterium UIB06]